MEADLVEVAAEDVAPGEGVLVDQLEGQLLLVLEEGDRVFYDEKAQFKSKGQA